MARNRQSQKSKAGAFGGLNKKLNAEDRSLWQRVVDSLEWSKTHNKTHKKSSTHDEHIILENDAAPSTPSSRPPKTPSSQPPTQHLPRSPQNTKPRPIKNIPSHDPKEDLGLWEAFKTTLERKPSTKDTPNLNQATAKTPIKHRQKAISSTPSTPSIPPIAPIAPNSSNVFPSKFPMQHHPLEDRIAKKIAKKRLSIDATLDLHGMTQAQAHSRLEQFLIKAQKNNFNFVLVITGKGVEGQGILRQSVPQWLHSPPFAHLTNGFRDAYNHHGGTGALYIRVRKLRGAK